MSRIIVLAAAAAVSAAVPLLAWGRGEVAPVRAGLKPDAGPPALAAQPDAGYPGPSQMRQDAGFGIPSPMPSSPLVDGGVTPMRGSPSGR